MNSDQELITKERAIGTWQLNQFPYEQKQSFWSKFWNIFKRLFKKQNKKRPKPIGRVINIKKCENGYSIEIVLYDKYKDKIPQYSIEDFNLYAI